jgi:uncharacterized protein
VLMLRGSQTPGELKGRSERLHRFDSPAAVEETLERLIEREFVIRHPRQPGQKEVRYEQVLGGRDGSEDAPAPAELTQAENESAAETATSTSTSPDDRLDRIERELASLRGELASLREALGESG